ncbi:hypothetical protein RRG08_046820 [Elysia crispata]|uniref:Uncharacterized protein n=1 Tax=Elysia crispata TaxID=231223 RepID=A0AAE0ZML2_9GAST|nr:hypothetical protein RRG08_046820 [Elysia crispata]
MLGIWASCPDVRVAVTSGCPHQVSSWQNQIVASCLQQICNPFMLAEGDAKYLGVSPTNDWNLNAKTIEDAQSALEPRAAKDIAAL